MASLRRFAVKSWIAPVLAATAVTLGACATTADETAALRPDEIKAELASVSQEILDIDAWVRGQAGLGRDIGEVMQNRALKGRLLGLVYRQSELRAELVEAGYPRTAEEVRERITQIDQALAKRGETLAASGSRRPTSSLRMLVSSNPYPSSTPVTEGPYNSYGLFTPVYDRMTGVPGSASPRSLDWQRAYSLKEERAALQARLQTVEHREN
jgi:hypothetical protein